MLGFTHPLWSLLLLLVPLIWWLHRRGQQQAVIEVSALFLWRNTPGTAAGILRHSHPDWLLRAAVVSLLGLSLAQPWWQGNAALPGQEVHGVATDHPIAIETRGDCPQALLTAVDVYSGPGRERSQSESSSQRPRLIRVDCSHQLESTPVPVLWFPAGQPFRTMDEAPWWSDQALQDLYLEARWIEAAPVPDAWRGARPVVSAGNTGLILRRHNQLLVALNLDHPDLVHQSVYPVLVQRLLDLLQQSPDSSVNTRNISPPRLELATYLLCLAGLLMLLDILRVRRRAAQ